MLRRLRRARLARARIRDSASASGRAAWQTHSGARAKTKRPDDPALSRHARANGGELEGPGAVVSEWAGGLVGQSSRLRVFALTAALSREKLLQSCCNLCFTMASPLDALVLHWVHL